MAAPKKDENKKKTVRLDLSITPEKLEEFKDKTNVYAYIHESLDNKEKIKQFINQQNK